MNWIKKTLRIGEKIKRLINKHRPTKEEMEKSGRNTFIKNDLGGGGIGVAQRIRAINRIFYR